MSMPRSARTYNQDHVRPQIHAGQAPHKHLLDVELSLGGERDPAAMDNRFSTMTEVRQRPLAGLRDPGVERRAVSSGHRRNAGAVSPLDALSFQKIAGETTGHPVAVFQRIDQAGYKLPIDERILADTDTLMVFGLDHILSRAGSGAGGNRLRSANG